MRRAGRLLRKLVGMVAIVAVLALAAVILVPAVLGYERYVIQTGSMKGTYDPGSIVFDEVTPVAELEEGDVITYGPPGAEGNGHLVTHRIVSIDTAKGKLAFRTKGDANDSRDPYAFYPDEPALPRVEASVPYVGYAYAELNTRRGRTIAFAVPGVLVAIWVLVGLWRDAGEDVRKRRLEVAAERTEGS